MEQTVLQKVEECYNTAAAQNFQIAVNHNQERYDCQALDYFQNNLPSPIILQLGFGNGTPLGKRYLQKSLAYQGIQLSEKQIELAHQLMPNFKDNFQKAEMVSFCEKASNSSYAGIVSMFAILHLTPSQQLILFQNVHRILVPNGLFIIGTVQKPLPFIQKYYEDEKVRVGFIDNYMGAKTCYEASFPPIWYQITLKTLGFELKKKTLLPIKFGGQEQDTCMLVFRKKQMK